MSNTEGSADNPLSVEDLPGPAAYIQIDSDGEVTELPAHAVPVSGRARKRGKSSQDVTNTTPGQGSNGRNANSTEREYPRIPSAKPDARAIIPNLSDDDGPGDAGQQNLPPNKTNAFSSAANTEMPSTSGQYLAVSKSHLPERTKLSGTSSSSFSISQASLPSAIRGQSFPHTSPNVPSISPGKEGKKSADILSVGLEARVPAQSAGIEATSVDRLGERQQRLVPYPHLPRELQTNTRPLTPSNAAKNDTIVTKPPKSPIGSRADHGRERTTMGHVGRNATLEPARLDIANKTGKTTKPSELAGKERKTGGSGTPKLPQKPRAIKSAVNPPKRNLGSNGLDHRLARNNARSPGSEQTPSRSLSNEAHGRYNVHKVPSEHHNLNVGGHQEDIEPSAVAKPPLSTASPQNSDSVISSAKPTSMGVHVSAIAAASSNILPSDKLPTTVCETPQVGPTQTQSGLLHSQQSQKAAGENVVQKEPLLALIRSHDDQVPSRDAQAYVVTDVEATRRGIEVSLKRHLHDRYEDHTYLVKNAMWRQRTCFERENRAKSNGKQPLTASMLPDKFIQATSPFDKMSTILTPFARSSSKGIGKDVTQEMFIKAVPKDTVVRSSWSVPTTMYKPEALCIPSFKEYVSLRTNILADNESKILTIPWLDDDDEEAQNVLVDKMPFVYEIKHDANALLDLRNEQCRFYIEVVDTFLVDTSISWDTILFWLLSPDVNLQRINSSLHRHDDFEQVILDRSSYSTEPFYRAGEEKVALLFERSSDQWQELLNHIKEPSAAQLRVAALVTAALRVSCRFNPWYMAEQCKTMQQHVQSKTKAATDISTSYRDRVCRVCHEHNCMFHGEIREEPESGSENEEQRTEEDIEDNERRKSSPPTNSSQESHSSSDDDGIMPAHFDEDDSDLEKVINYRLPTNPEVQLHQSWSDHGAAKRAVPPPGPFKPRWWELNTSTATWEKRKPFLPCNHDGNCAEAKCRCFREGVTCEKTCKCSLDCNRRFPGCRCTSAPGKRACATAASCLCVRFKRECDADLCGTCGAAELLDPVNRYNEDMLQKRCTNVGIQRGVPKKTLLGQSEVHGFGLYAGEDIRKDEIVGEYTGEILSVEESGRREIIYEYEKNMYLFKLNKKQDVDATHMGNKLRFINNAHAHLSNCFPKNLFCNTVFRVGLYATTDIKAGTELFFHYNYPEELTKNFKQPKSKVVAVRQIVKQPSKAKLNRNRLSSAPSSSGIYIENQRPRNLESLAIARAAKAAKRAAMLAEGTLQAPNTSRGTASKHARKSAAGGLTSYQKSEYSAPQDRPKRRRDLDIPDGSATETSNSFNATSPSRIIQDTDEDEDISVPQYTQEGANASDLPVSDVEAGNAKVARNNTPSNATSLEQMRPRAGAANATSVVAVKETKKKMGGARPGAGRKRKRPVVLNSDDE